MQSHLGRFRSRPFRRYTAGVALLAPLAAAPAADAAQMLFGQTFYSQNTGLTEDSGSLVWTTPTGSNSEMHTHFGPLSVAVGERFVLSTNLSFTEPQGDGGNGAVDGIRIGLMDLVTQTNADGAHAATGGEGYRFRFNWETATDVQGGVGHERTAGGSSVNYLTTSGGIWDQSAQNFNGFGLNADGSTSYPMTLSVTRTNATDAVVDLTINGVTRTYTDTGDGVFSFDTFALAKISDQAPFTEASTFRFSSFSVQVVPIPEPTTAALCGAAATGLLLRRRRSRT
jgi:hypothetical protein